jgi:hypothetical protein
MEVVILLLVNWGVRGRRRGFAGIFRLTIRGFFDTLLAASTAAKMSLNNAKPAELSSEFQAKANGPTAGNPRS